MLGQLTGLLFGGGAEATPVTREEPAAATTVPEGATSAPCRALPVEDPELDEWVLVAEGASPAPSSAATPACSTTPGTPTSQMTVEDNWTLTPPACFSRRGQPALPPASSLENLLIEHPSMSVYVRGDYRARSRSESRSLSRFDSTSPTPELEAHGVTLQRNDDLRGEDVQRNEEFRPVEPQRPEDADRLEDPPRTAAREAAAVAHMRPPPAPAPTRRPPSALNAQKLHRRAVTQAQLATQQRRNQTLKSGRQTQRENRTRHVQSAGNGPMRRKHHYTSGRHSGANNNRKC